MFRTKKPDTANYFLTDDQKMIRDLAAQIAKEKIAPIAAELDETGEFPWDIVKTLGTSDLFRVFIDEAYEGIAGKSPIFNMVFVTEELSRACGGIALAIAGSALGALPIILAGSEEQKRRFLPDVAAGRRLAAFALTEPQAGSDAGAIATTARRDGDHYVLNGTKQWITNGGEAEIYSCRARSAPWARRAMVAMSLSSWNPGVLACAQASSVPFANRGFRQGRRASARTCGGDRNGTMYKPDSAEVQPPRLLPEEWRCLASVRWISSPLRAPHSGTPVAQQADGDGD